MTGNRSFFVLMAACIALTVGSGGAQSSPTSAGSGAASSNAGEPSRQHESKSNVRRRAEDLAGAASERFSEILSKQEGEKPIQVGGADASRERAQRSNRPTLIPVWDWLARASRDYENVIIAKLKNPSGEVEIETSPNRAMAQGEVPSTRLAQDAPASQFGWGSIIETIRDWLARANRSYRNEIVRNLVQPRDGEDPWRVVVRADGESDARPLAQAGGAPTEAAAETERRALPAPTEEKSGTPEAIAPATVIAEPLVDEPATPEEPTPATAAVESAVTESAPPQESTPATVIAEPEEEAGASGGTAEIEPKLQAEEAKRLAEEAAAKRKAAIAAETKRLTDEVQAKRLAEEAAAEREAARVAEAKQLAEEAESKRLAEEAEARFSAAKEEEAKRLADEAEAKRVAEEAEAKRKADEAAEAQRLAKEAEAKRESARKEEAKRLAEEAEAKRLAEEAEAKRLAEVADAKRKAAIEADAIPLDNEVAPKRVAESAPAPQIDDQQRASDADKTETPPVPVAKVPSSSVPANDRSPAAGAEKRIATPSRPKAKRRKVRVRKARLRKKRVRKSRYSRRRARARSRTRVYTYTARGKRSRVTRYRKDRWARGAKHVSPRKVHRKRARVHGYRKRHHVSGHRRGGMYVLRRGDTLWGIAKRHYGKGSSYRRIYRANRHKIRRPNLIYPRQHLYIPSRRR